MIFKALLFVMLAIEINNPISIAKKIEIIDRITVYPKPPIKNSIFDSPTLLFGMIAYQPHW